MTMVLPSLAPKKRRGNPNWGQARSLSDAPVPTEFEFVTEGMPSSLWGESETIRAWVKRNKDRRYVPEWLLDVYHLKCQDDLSSVGPGCTYFRRPSRLLLAATWLRPVGKLCLARSLLMPSAPAKSAGKSSSLTLTSTR